MQKPERPPTREEKEPQPELLPEAIWLWDAFITLTGQRHFGKVGPQPITLADIKAYADLHDLQGAEAVWLMEIVIKLDKIIVDDTYKKISREQEKANKKTTRSSRG